MFSLKKHVFEQLKEWTLTERPNEAAGYLFKDNTLFRRIITDNHSGVHFFDENPEQFLEWIEEYGRPTAIFHSHPMSAVPSITDLIYMRNTIPYFECIWLIMSNSLKLRAWTVREITLILNEVEVNII